MWYRLLLCQKIFKINPPIILESQNGIIKHPGFVDFFKGSNIFKSVHSKI